MLHSVTALMGGNRSGGGKFEKYSKIPMPNGMTGKDVAEKMLHDNGIYDVKVISTPGPANSIAQIQ